jgi:hypothetical protein
MESPAQTQTQSQVSRVLRSHTVLAAPRQIHLDRHPETRLQPLVYDHLLRGKEAEMLNFVAQKRRTAQKKKMRDPGGFCANRRAVVTVRNPYLRYGKTTASCALLDADEQKKKTRF